MAKAGAAKSSAAYDMHPGVAMVQRWVAELKQKTGRSLEEWIALVNEEGPKEEKARLARLNKKHKLGTNSAWWIAERSVGKGGEEDTLEAYLKAAVRYVEEQYASPKEKLRPIFEELLKLGRSMEKTSRFVPARPSCRYISFSRKSSQPRIRAWALDLC